MRNKIFIRQHQVRKDEFKHLFFAFVVPALLIDVFSVFR